MNFYLGRNGKRLGPYSAEQMEEMWSQGMITQQDVACAEGADSWVPVHVALGKPAFIRPTPPPPALAPRAVAVHQESYSVPVEPPRVALLESESPSKAVLWISLLLISAAAVGVYASPYWAAYQLKKSIERNDIAALKEDVDFAALRVNLKDNLRSEMTRIAMGSTGRNAEEVAGAFLGVNVVGAITDTTVEELLTPVNLAAALGGKRLTIGGVAQDRRAQSAVPDADMGWSEAWEQMGYEGWSRFAVRLPDSGPMTKMALVFQRSSPISWRLAQFRFHLDETAREFKQPGPGVPAVMSERMAADLAPRLDVTALAARAQEGNAEAQLQLGKALLEGRVVESDPVLAYFWLNLAAAEGQDGAVELRARAASTLSAEQLAEAQRKCREWRPRPATATNQ
jgi:hypothetical protein